jgi:hypothetical protein
VVYFFGGGDEKNLEVAVNAGVRVYLNPLIFVVSCGAVFSILNSLSYRSFQCDGRKGRYVGNSQFVGVGGLVWQSGGEERCLGKVGRREVDRYWILIFGF